MLGEPRFSSRSLAFGLALCILTLSLGVERAEAVLYIQGVAISYCGENQECDLTASGKPPLAALKRCIQKLDMENECVKEKDELGDSKSFLRLILEDTLGPPECINGGQGQSEPETEVRFATHGDEIRNVVVASFLDAKFSKTWAEALEFELEWLLPSYAVEGPADAVCKDKTTLRDVQSATSCGEKAGSHNYPLLIPSEGSISHQVLNRLEKGPLPNAVVIKTESPCALKNLKQETKLFAVIEAPLLGSSAFSTVALTGLTAACLLLAYLPL